MGSFRSAPRLSAEIRLKVGLHGKSVAKISGVASDPMGSAFAVEMNSLTYLGPWQNGHHDHR